MFDDPGPNKTPKRNHAYLVIAILAGLFILLPIGLFALNTFRALTCALGR